MPRTLLLALALLWTRDASAIHLGCVGPSPVTGYMFTPNCTSTNQASDGVSWPFTTNDVGLVAVPNYREYPENDTLRVLTVGPSELVNLSPQLGIVPVMEKVLREGWKKTGHYRRIEVINGAEAGFTAVQAYLRLPELLRRYHPAAVLYLHAFPGMSLKQVDDHFGALGYDDRGLATRMRSSDQFWPFPSSWSSWIQEHVRNPSHLWTQLIGIRLAFYKLLARLEIGRYASRDSLSPYAYVHLSYLEGMRRKAEQTGAKFFVLNNMSVDYDPVSSFETEQKLDSWYKADWVAGRYLPWPHLKSEDVRVVYERMRRGFAFVALENIPNVPELHYKGDYHSNDKGLVYLGQNYARILGPVLKAAFAGAR